MFVLELSRSPVEIGDADDDMVDFQRHLEIMPRAGIDSFIVKRISPLILIALAAAAAVALFRSSHEPEPAEDWKPVQPS